MENFANALRNEAKGTVTENGAYALNTTSSALLDLFSVIGALRDPNGKTKHSSLTNVNKNRAKALFDEAYKEDKLVATKILFYARDIREGLGEREVFRYLLNYVATTYPEALVNNIHLIGTFGRWDDLYSLIHTPLEQKMWEVMKSQFRSDLENMENKKEISLLGKWIATADASSVTTKKLGCLTAKKLGYSVYEYKRKYRALRKYLKVIECAMSTGKWDTINYPAVPSRAMTIYRNAFSRHDGDRFSQYLEDVSSGKESINANTLYPYDIVEKFLYDEYSLSKNDKSVLENQWKALPNYVEPNTNAIVMADVSGSMYGRPMATSVGLALYFAERNHGAYENMFMTFSYDPEIVMVKGKHLETKINNISRAKWSMSTNLLRAFDKVLKIAIDNKIPSEDIPKSIIVISDMEIDACTDKKWTFYDTVRNKYASHGYQIPNVVFWNVNSRNNVYHVDKSRKGVQCFSGSSASTFKSIMKTVGMNPVEAMYHVINSDRYSCITV